MEIMIIENEVKEQSSFSQYKLEDLQNAYMNSGIVWYSSEKTEHEINSEFQKSLYYEHEEYIENKEIESLKRIELMDLINEALDAKDIDLFHKYTQELKKLNN